MEPNPHDYGPGPPQPSPPTTIPYATPRAPGDRAPGSSRPFVVFVICAAVAGWAAYASGVTGNDDARAVCMAVLTISGLAAIVLPLLLRRDAGG